jgi:hypothetical protein
VLADEPRRQQRVADPLLGGAGPLGADRELVFTDYLLIATNPAP